jgi:protein-tyrosine phosphatase
LIDWHSHILPGVDDGSKTLGESLALLEMQRGQGVDVVLATPHFYANQESVSDFLKRRQQAFDALQAALPENAPRILQGAEVRYYQGISRLSDLKDLRVEGSPVLLLEMPISRWSEGTIRELIELSALGGIKLVLAHIERYLQLQSRSVWDHLHQNGILMQVNAGFFTSFGKWKAFSLLRNGGIHFIGSDCHDLVCRPPQLGRALEIIRKKCGEAYIIEMDEFGRDLLGL